MSIPIDIFSPAQAAILYGIAAVLGACLGSFVNCLAWRMVNDESVLKGRSHCTRCGHALGVLDLVPVVSWLALRGRCRHCGEKVSPRYVVAEATMALVFVALLAVHGMGVPTIAYMALACVLMGVALVDLDSYTIPNGFVVAAMAIWAGSMWFMRVPLDGVFGVGSMFMPFVESSWMAVALDGLAGAAVVGGGILVFSLAFDAVTKRASLGGGDVKLLFAVGLFLGLAGSLLNLLIACVLGLAFAVVRGLSAPSAPSEGRARPEGGLQDGVSESFGTKAIPFGPAIAAATVLTLLAGPTVLTWYTGLF